MYLIEDGETENPAYAGNGPETEIGISVIFFGYKGYLVFNSVKQLIIVVYETQIEFYAILDAQVRKPLGHAFAIAFLPEILFYGRKIVLVIGILHMGKQFSPFPCKMISSSEQVSGRARLGGIDIGHGHHAAPKQSSYFIGVYFVVFGFASMDGFHVECTAKDKRDILLAAEIGKPVPGEDALNGNNNVLTVGAMVFRKISGFVLMSRCRRIFPSLSRMQRYIVHSPCVQIDTAVKFVLMGVKSHVRPPWYKGFWVPESYLFRV